MGKPNNSTRTLRHLDPDPGLKKADRLCPFPLKSQCQSKLMTISSSANPPFVPPLEKGGLGERSATRKPGKYSHLPRMLAGEVRGEAEGGPLASCLRSNSFPLTVSLGDTSRIP